MTVEQVSSYLAKFNYSLDSWIPFDEVSMVFLDQDGRVFVDRKRQRYNFGSDNILRIADGYENKDGSFKDSEGNTTDFKTSHWFDYEKIFGFIRNTKVGPWFRYEPNHDNFERR